MFTAEIGNKAELLVTMWQAATVDTTHWQLLKTTESSSWHRCSYNHRQTHSASSSTACRLTVTDNCNMFVYIQHICRSGAPRFPVTMGTGLKQGHSLSKKSTCGQAPTLAPLCSQLFQIIWHIMWEYEHKHRWSMWGLTDFSSWVKRDEAMHYINNPSYIWSVLPLQLLT